MSQRPSPEPILGKDLSLVTPRVNYDSRQFLSPPPAPLGCVYNESDVLSNSFGTPTEKRHVMSSSSIPNTPLFDFPLELGSCEVGYDRNERIGDSPGPGRRRRATSFDCVPLPRISLRPRFNMNIAAPNSMPGRNFERLNDRIPNEEESTRGHTRRTHLRSHTYDGDQSVFAAAVSQELSPFPFSNLPSIPSGIDMTSIERGLPILPPKPFLDYPTTYDNRGITKPVPRHKRGNGTHSPSERRLYLGNASEATTTSCTIASSSNSAFDAPSIDHKNPNSPLTPGSESTSSLLGNDCDGLTGVRIYSEAVNEGSGFLPFFSQYDADDNSLCRSDKLKKKETVKSELHLPFDEVHLHREVDQSTEDPTSKDDGQSCT